MQSNLPVCPFLLRPETTQTLLIYVLPFIFACVHSYEPLSLSKAPPADSIAAYSYQAFAAVMLHFGDVMRH